VYLLPLVCKRLRALASSPELLRKLSVTWSGVQELEPARGLLAWLPLRARHVREVQLQFTLEEGDWEGASAACNEAVAVLASCLTLLAHEGLEQLRVDIPWLPTVAWLPLMPGLRRATVNIGNDMMSIGRGLHSLTQLRSLELQAGPVVFETSARLPPSLTSLTVHDSSAEEEEVVTDWRVSGLAANVMHFQDCFYGKEAWWVSSAARLHGCPPDLLFT